MKKLIILTAFILLLAPVSALAKSLEGMYDCKGVNPNKIGGYKGKVMIEAKGKTYRFTWSIGRQTFIGVGINVGKLLSVAYTTARRNWFGTVVYQIDDKANKLLGKWTSYPGGDSLGRETLTRRVAK